MKFFAGLILAATMLTAAVPAAANFSGEYTVVFLSGPQHYRTASYCFVFSNTGTIYGFPDSGTWQEIDNADWGGNFVVDGDMLRWYGTLGTSEVMNFYNSIKGGDPGKGGFDDWFWSEPPIKAETDGTTKMKPGCKTR